MIHSKSTLYPLAGSLAVNMMLTMCAGSFLISINKSLATQKTYKLEFVKRKTPPPIKKEKIRKEVTHQQVKLASLQAKVLPVKQPSIQPKMFVRQTNTARPSVSVPNYVPRKVQSNKAPPMQSTVMHSSTSKISRRVTSKIPTARSFASVNDKKSKKSTTRTAMVQGVSQLKAHKVPSLVTRSSADKSSSKDSRGLISPVLTGVKHASLSLPANPRGVPNIVDSGALKSYIGQIQRIIEGEKRYPEASRRAGREGKLKVQFTIFRDGKVGNIKLLTKTPYPNLNKEAMDAVERAAPFSGFPDSMGKKYVNIILPFRFELN